MPNKLHGKVHEVALTPRQLCFSLIPAPPLPPRRNEKERGHEETEDDWGETNGRMGRRPMC
eukprot:292500-Pyramimonas_sp.AAC.2